ncbi:MAG: hypothetical protein JW772_00875 [Candidatus Diapherotrites archaeon]|nr:hypothetical protein [Candidatus Diapherotrites archaeon]
MGEEKTEGRKIIDSASNALAFTIFIIVIGWLFGIPEAFGQAISIIGFALIFLMFYAIR